MIRQKIIEEARKLIGVPFRHQGRDRRYGLDCVGVAVVVSKALGVYVHDRADYGRWPGGNNLLVHIKNSGFKETTDPQPGDLLVFIMKRFPQHVAIMTDKGIIHAHENSKKVVEHGFTDKWKKRLYKAYTIGD